MSGNPTTTPTNVVPMPTNWPGPMFNPGGRSWPTPPSCFSELASLNACYDSVQMMEQILAKVMTDLVTNNAAVQTAIVEAIAKSGSNVPLIGVTNGSNAQPGQVGEFLVSTQTVNFPANATLIGQPVQTLLLPPGDWDIWAWAGQMTVEAAVASLNPEPAGFSNQLPMGFWSGGPQNGVYIVAPTARGSVSTPTLLVFNFAVASAAAGSTTFQVEARRSR